MPSSAESSPPQQDRHADAPIVAAIVVSHNSGRDLAACVTDLLAQTLPLQVIVVDNASVDGCLSHLPAHPAVQVIRNQENRGFGVACNQGAERVAAPYLLFINPDCRLHVEAVSQLHQHLRALPTLGMLGARLCHADGRPQAAAVRQTPRPREAILQALGRRSFEAEMILGEQGAVQFVEATSGALMLMPRPVFTQLGGFDPGYVLHCEDLDLCRRVLLAGWQIGVARDVSIVHFKGTSSRRRPIWVEWQKHRGMWRYFRKFDAADSPFWLSALVALGLVARFPIAAARAWWQRNA